MDKRVIDYLYNRYANKYVYDQLKEKEDEEYFRSLNLTKEQIIQHLTEYVNQNTVKFAQSYQSIIDENQEDFEIIENLKELFQDVFYALDDYLSYKRMEDFDFAYDEFKDYNDKCYSVSDDNLFNDNECFGVDEYNEAFEIASSIKMTDLFKIDINFIEAGFYYRYDKDQYYENIFSQFKRIISFIKEKGTLNKLYGEGKWYDVDFDKLLTDLYDYHKKNKNIFNTSRMNNSLINHNRKPFIFDSGFAQIKSRCSSLSYNGEIYQTSTNRSLTFDRYRPYLSKK